MKILYLLVFMVLTPLWASVRPTPMQNVADELAVSLGVYKRHVSIAPLNSWQQLASVAPGFYGLNAMTSGQSVTEIFSIIGQSERGKFPSGNLIFAQSAAMPWPDAWKTEDREKPGEYLPHRSHQDIRFLVYEKDGKFIAERWYETKFQAMLAETGLTIPPPTPYYPPPPTPPGEKPAAPSTLAAPIATTQSAPAAAHLATPTPATAPATPPAKSSNLLWWIVGAIAALAAVLFLATRKKKPRA